MCHPVLSLHFLWGILRTSTVHNFHKPNQNRADRGYQRPNMTIPSSHFAVTQRCPRTTAASPRLATPPPPPQRGEFSSTPPEATTRTTGCSKVLFKRSLLTSIIIFLMPAESKDCKRHLLTAHIFCLLQAIPAYCKLYMLTASYICSLEISSAYHKHPMITANRANLSFQAAMEPR